jgi:hypothetical protein
MSEMNEAKYKHLVCHACEIIIPNELQNENCECGQCGDELCFDNGECQDFKVIETKQSNYLKG